MSMTLPKPFSHLHMTKLIADQLVPFIKNPETLPPVTCLYGFPGCGKTDFAKAFASNFALITDYHAVNEYSPAHLRSKAFAKELKADTNTNVLSFSDDKQKCFNHVTIFDEFHDLSERSQASFKTRFDRIKETDRVFVIINTKEKKTAEDVLHPAIYSRSLCIDFDMLDSDAEAHAKFLTKKFKNLTATQIYSLLPDMRRITRENDLRS